LLISPHENFEGFKFEKKIITSTDKSIPDAKEVVLTNLGAEPLQWLIDTS